ncbi:MAG: MBL fold metallo-hydrolase [Proteobacteria bacterium]|nr:MBL fold metallo-hydrolase [Pseudomonadota bacterium]
MRIAVLASGSSGNATVVEAGNSAVLIDCGLSVRRLEGRAAELNFDLQHLTAIVVTHEHGDHIGGVGALARRYKLPVYMTHGTFIASSFGEQRGIDVHEISPHEPFSVGSLQLHPAPVPHDAKEPCQFVVEFEGLRIGVLTDFGSETQHINQHFANCNALVLEFNHDPLMLDACEYPDSVKDRIAGRLGHFNNQQAVQLLAKLSVGPLCHVLAAHISERANCKSLVEQQLAATLSGTNVAWDVAHQDRASAWITV